MNIQKIESTTITLVDRVEEELLTYLTNQDFKIGDKLPSETELSESLGVTRNVVREALSRLKMMGMVESRTRRGMILTEPAIFGGMQRAICPKLMSRQALLELLAFRVALEVGITGFIFQNVTNDDIWELEQILHMQEAMGENIYANLSEHQFHSKLYEITRNKTIMNFQSIIQPVIEFVKANLRSYVSRTNAELRKQGELVTHQKLLELIKTGDEDGYRKAIEQHFFVYREIIRNRGVETLEVKRELPEELKSMISDLPTN